MLENGTAVSFEVSSMAAATVSSLFGAGAVIGAVPAGAVCSVFGRRVSLIVSEAHVVFGWLMIAYPKAARMLYVGRILQGVGCGAMCTIIPMYVGEIAEPEIRGPRSFRSFFFPLPILPRRSEPIRSTDKYAFRPTTIPGIYAGEELWRFRNDCHTFIFEPIPKRIVFVHYRGTLSFAKNPKIH